MVSVVERGAERQSRRRQTSWSNCWMRIICGGTLEILSCHARQLSIRAANAGGDTLIEILNLRLSEWKWSGSGERGTGRGQGVGNRGALSFRAKRESDAKVSIGIPRSFALDDGASILTLLIFCSPFTVHRSLLFPYHSVLSPFHSSPTEPPAPSPPPPPPGPRLPRSCASSTPTPACTGCRARWSR